MALFLHHFIFHYFIFSSLYSANTFWVPGCAIHRLFWALEMQLWMTRGKCLFSFRVLKNMREEYEGKWGQFLTGWKERGRKQCVHLMSPCFPVLTSLPCSCVRIIWWKFLSLHLVVSCFKSPFSTTHTLPVLPLESLCPEIQLGTGARRCYLLI